MTIFLIGVLLVNTATFDLASFGLPPLRLSVVDIAPLETLPAPAVQTPAELELRVRTIPGQVPRLYAGPSNGPVWLHSARFEIVDIVWFDLDQTIADYCAAWSEPDVARRRELLNKVWTQGGTYTDPEVQLHGQPDLMNYITRFHQRFPGVKIVVTSKVDVHHGVGRFSWRMVEGSGTTRVEGLDFVEFTPDGRIKRIVGFFGPLKQ